MKPHFGIRVLSLDPHPRGFGFAVFEGPARLVGWGTRDVRRNKERTAFQKLEKLIRFYRPQVIVVEDCDHGSSRRRSRIKALTRKIVGTARAAGIAGQAVSPVAVHRSFAKHGARTKYEIAVALTRLFPELSPRLPRPRKIYQSEDSRMSIFDAAALGIAYLDRSRHQSDPEIRPQRT